MVPFPDGADVSGSMRALLRASTAGLHSVVDARFAPMLGSGEAGYRSFLLASAAAVFPLEQALLAADVGAILPDWAQRARTAALRRRSRRSRRRRRAGRTAAAAGGGGPPIWRALCPKAPARRKLSPPQLLARGSSRVRHATAFRASKVAVVAIVPRASESSEATRRCPDDAIAGARAAICAVRHRPSPGRPSVAAVVDAETADAD